MYNNTPYNILASFAYLGANEQFRNTLFSLHKQKRINVMIDSGAFTAHNSPKSAKLVTLDNYCDFLFRYGEWCEKYVMLDVIGNADASRANYETMLKRGLNPMWVATIYDNDFAYMTDAVKNNPNICVAGGATCKSDWQSQRYQRVYKNTGSVARIHGLGYVTQPKMYQLPLASVDSSTWNTGLGSFGYIPVFKPGKGIWGMWWRDIASGKSIRPEVKEILERLGLTPKIMLEPNNHKGDRSVSRLASIYCHVQMQRYAKRCGLDYFLAVGSAQNLKDILWVVDNWHYLDYTKFRKYKELK